MKFEACKHLVFDKEKIDSRCKIVAVDGLGVYWKRPEVIALDGVTDCQFCELRGRMPGKLNCLKHFAECDKYEAHEYDIDMDKVE